jgi:hypothetical protein
MQSKTIQSVIVFSLGIIMAMFLVSGAFTTNTSSISYLIKYLGIALAIVCFIKPRWGIYIVISEAFLTDYLKKIAVYYGNESMQTIIEVMAVVMAALLATYIGRVLSAIISRDNSLSKVELSFYFFGALFAIAAFASSFQSIGAVGAGQKAFNSGVYLGFGGLIVGLIKSREERLQLLKFTFVFSLLWTVVAMKQYFLGFSTIEWAYAETGLSQVATDQMFLERYIEPRPFGLGSGSPNFTSIAPFFTIGIIIFIYSKNTNQKILAVLLTLIMIGGILVSQGKSAIAIAFLIPCVALFFRGAKRTFAFYLTAFMALISLIYYSEFLLYNLEDISNVFLETMGLSSSWSIQTYAPRLESLMILKDPTSWTMFGGNELYGHSMLVTILSEFGAVGFILGGLVLGLLLWFFHRVVLSSRAEDRFLTSMAASGAILIFLIASLNGSGLYSQPVCLVIAILAGTALARGNEPLSHPPTVESV